MQILVVEDERRMAELLRRGLPPSQIMAYYTQWDAAARAAGSPSRQR